MSAAKKLNLLKLAGCREQAASATRVRKPKDCLVTKARGLGTWKKPVYCHARHIPVQNCAGLPKSEGSGMKMRKSISSLAAGLGCETQAGLGLETDKVAVVPTWRETVDAQLGATKGHRTRQEEKGRSRSAS